MIETGHLGRHLFRWKSEGFREFQVTNMTVAYAGDLYLRLSCQKIGPFEDRISRFYEIGIRTDLFHIAREIHKKSELVVCADSTVVIRNTVSDSPVEAVFFGDLSLLLHGIIASLFDGADYELHPLQSFPSIHCLTKM
ncbi:hypothetical protein ES703_106478 [subsurface metagenome]